MLSTSQEAIPHTGGAGSSSGSSSSNNNNNNGGGYVYKPTEGINIKEWNSDNLQSTIRKLNINIWDFSGNEVYKTTHNLFIDDYLIYILFFNLSSPLPSIIKQLTYWLDIISSYAPYSETILIGI